MIPVLLILIPLLGGVVTFFLKNEKTAKSFSLFVSFVVLACSLAAIVVKDEALLFTNVEWMPLLGSNFNVGLDGMGKLLVLLTGVAYPVIFIATWHHQYARANSFYALMLLSCAGLIGVFVAFDALLFYFFWELALIPAYFLCGQWGGERRMAVTFKFFIYTFIGSLFMLLGLIYIYLKTPEQSFSLDAFYKLNLSNADQAWLFWIMFAAFAVKMPIFPLHTWQPDTYEQSSTATTMVLSGIMVKMGVFGVLRWLVPVVSVGSWAWGDTVSMLAVIGMVYASLIAMKQDDLKRLVAYSSIAHMGLMCVAIFATTNIGMQGVMIQMFSHGINIIALWIVVEWIERRFNTRKMSELGGLAQKAPTMAIMLVIIALANVALPLTNAFVGEFMMFTGIFTSNVSKFNIVFTVAALVTIILSAVYTFNMLQKVLFGETSAVTANATDLRVNEKLILGVLVVLILVFGVYPQPMLDLTSSTADAILSRMITKHP